MRRKDQPSRPKAIICCRLSSLNTLLMAPEATCLAGDVNVPARLLLYGRFCGVHEWPLLGVHRGPISAQNSPTIESSELTPHSIYGTEARIEEGKSYVDAETG